MIAPAFFLLGAASWSAAEYAIHRFVGHGPKRSPPKSLLGRLSLSGLAYEFNREHLAHHTDPSYFAPTSRKVLAATVAVPMLGLALTPFLGPRRALSFGAGLALGYGAYEVLHRRVHTHPPRTAYGRWLRRNHLAHHYKTPRANHGVTSPLWDALLGTAQPLERIRIPSKTAPPWLHHDNDDFTLTPSRGPTDRGPREYTRGSSGDSERGDPTKTIF